MTPPYFLALLMKLLVFLPILIFEIILVFYVFSTILVLNDLTLASNLPSFFDNIKSLTNFKWTQSQFLTFGFIFIISTIVSAIVYFLNFLFLKAYKLNIEVADATAMFVFLILSLGNIFGTVSKISNF